ncbi:MAG TPA: ABC transporter ATP-binding protein [Actinobacteria bacterium]|nr:ABC transporter ATP-binding protein [Actinomycetota bacterium]
MPILELEAIEKHFGGLNVIEDVTLGVDDGEILAVVGPNGAGKSTLLKLVVGLELPSGGRIRFRGRDITGAPTHRIRQTGIAMVEQTPRPFPTLTVLENAAIGALFGTPDRRPSEAEAVEVGKRMLSLVGLADRCDAHVDGLNLHELRFLELARALAGRPRLLLLDEVMAGLNESELRASIEMVRAIRDELGVTVVWVEHVMAAVVELAERAVVLDFGRIIADGAPEEVMRAPRVVEAYLGAAGGAADA